MYIILFTLLIASSLTVTASSYSSLHDTSYDTELARTGFIASAAAYNPNPQKCLDTLQNDCVVEHTYNVEYEDGNISSFIGQCKDAVLISFRGTNSDTQLFWEYMELDNMSDFKLGDKAVGKVQTYFLGAFLKVYELMRTDIRTIISNNKTVFITGHSLGASLASLLSVQIAYEYPSTYIIYYTYGQPRVGDYNYAQLHDTVVPNSWRVVHQYDIVPHFPFCMSIYGCNYTNKPYHHGTEIFYNNNMSNIYDYIVCKTDEDEKCSNQYYKYIVPITEEMYYDHIYYFGVQVSTYGSTNCNNKDYGIDALRGIRGRVSSDLSDADR